MSEVSGPSAAKPGLRVLHVFATFDAGGPQVRAVQCMARQRTEAERVGQTPWQHSILAMNGRTGCAAQLPDGMPIQWIDPPPSGGVLATARWFGRRLAELSPDVILTYNWGSIEAVLGARLAGLHRRVVHHEDGFGPDEATRFLRRRIWFRRAAFRSIPAIAVPSLVLQDIGVRLWRQPESRIRYLPNGVDLQRFAPVARSERRAAPLVIGTVGGIRGEKFQALLVRAFARALELGGGDQALRLRIVGDGPDRPQVEALAAQLQVAEQTEFVGAVTDTSPVYRGLDIFALSSMTEQMPLVVLEAMASGLPVVSTDVGDVRAMVSSTHDEHRLIAPRPELRGGVDTTKATGQEASVEGLASAIVALAADPKLRARLGRENRERCERQYDLGACYGRYLELYARIAREA